MTYFFIQLKKCFLYFAFLGIASHFFGERLQRSKFCYDRHPYAPFSWEDDGNFYNKVLHIRKWRHLLPDKSQKVKSMYRKKLGTNLSSRHLLRLLQETCVAEFVHNALIVFSPFVLFFVRGNVAFVCMLLFMLGNLPFVMIQRYNRPKLARLYRAALIKEKLVHEQEQEQENQVSAI